MKYRKIMVCLLVFSLILFVGCSRSTLEFESIANHKDVVEDSEYGRITMEFSMLDGEDIRSFSTIQGKTYTFDYRYLITQGVIELQFRDSKDNVITSIAFSEDQYKETLKNVKKDADGKVEIHQFTGNIKVKSHDQKMKVAIIGKEAMGKINIIW